MVTKTKAVKATAKEPVEKPSEGPEIIGPVTLVPQHHFSIAINGTLATFHQGKSFVADVALQAALAAANAPVAKHE